MDKKTCFALISVLSLTFNSMAAGSIPVITSAAFSGSSWLRASDSDWSSSKGKSDIRRLAEEAQDGDVDAMRQLGIMSMKGQKVKKSTKIAIQWWKKAADRGDGRSMMYLGDVYGSGNGVRKDERLALKYYEDALKTAGDEADEVTDDDNIVIKRIKKLPLRTTLRWWEKRCSQGDTHAMYYLATLKKKQREGVLDDGKAAEYLIQAAKAGHAKARKKIEKAPKEQYLAYWAEEEKPGTTSEVNKEVAETKAKQDTHNSEKTSEGQDSASQDHTMAKNTVKQDTHSPEMPSEVKKSIHQELADAAGNGQYWKFEDLLKRGADPNYKSGNYPFSTFYQAAYPACRDGDLEGLRILAKYNPDIYDCSSRKKISIFTSILNYYNNCAHVERVFYALLDLVDYTSLPKGKLSSLCADKRSPLTAAATHGFVHCVEKMLKNGVSADDCQDGETRPPLHTMIYAMSNRSSFRTPNPDGFVKCFNMILAKADLNYISVEEVNGQKRYKTPLIVALEERLFPVATRLIDEGADVNARLYGTVNILGESLRGKARNDIVEYLVQAGAHVEHDPEAKKLLQQYEKAWYWYQKKYP